MRLKEFELDHYLFGMGEEALSAVEKRKISRRVEHEMMEIFSGRNLAAR